MIKWLQKQALNFVLKQHQKYISSNGGKGVRLSFHGRHIPRVDFTDASMGSSEFNRATLKYCDFSFATMSESCFTQTDMSYSKFEQANLFKADLAEAQLRKATHQIHVRNRQKEDMIRIFDKIKNMGESDFKRQLTKFLRDNDVQQPRI